MDVQTFLMRWRVRKPDELGHVPTALAERHLLLHEAEN
jgi:hypothetical protein